MQVPSFDLVDYLIENLGKARHDLASSNLSPLRLEDLGLPRDVNPGEAYPEGTKQLRAAVAEISGVTPDRVMTTVGASEANLLVGYALLERGDKVVVESPYYEPLAKAFQFLGMEVVFLPRRFEERFRLNLEEDHLTGAKLLVLTNLHNPGGVLIDDRGLREVARMAEEEDFLVLVDEVFREAAFDRTPPCAATLSDRCIVTSSPSKFYGLGGLRVGWCLAEPEILSRMRAVKVLGTVAPSILSEHMAARALQLRDDVRQRNRDLVEKNRNIVGEWIEGQERLEWVAPDGYVSFPRFEGNVEKLARIALERHGTLIAPGRFFGVKEYFRLCFGMGMEELVAGLEGLGKAINEA